MSQGNQSKDKDSKIVDGSLAEPDIDQTQTTIIQPADPKLNVSGQFPSSQGGTVSKQITLPQPVDPDLIEDDDANPWLYNTGKDTPSFTGSYQSGQTPAQAPTGQTQNQAGQQQGNANVQNQQSSWKNQTQQSQTGGKNPKLPTPEEIAQRIEAKNRGFDKILAGLTIGVVLLLFGFVLWFAFLGWGSYDPIKWFFSGVLAISGLGLMIVFFNKRIIGGADRAWGIGLGAWFTLTSIIIHVFSTTNVFVSVMIYLSVTIGLIIIAIFSHRILEWKKTGR